MKAVHKFLITQPNVFDTLDPRWHICIIKKQRKKLIRQNINIFFFSVMIEIIWTLVLNMHEIYNLYVIAATNLAPLQVLLHLSTRNLVFFERRYPHDIEMCK
jgi:hypothetical protein